jgi:hypothetical protein
MTKYSPEIESYGTSAERFSTEIIGFALNVLVDTRRRGKTGSGLEFCAGPASL